MATAAAHDSEWIPMTATELLSIRGTPEFEIEVKRQLSVIAEHDRKNNFADHMEPDWEYLDKVWK